MGLDGMHDTTASLLEGEWDEWKLSLEECCVLLFFRFYWSVGELVVFALEDDDG